VIEPTAAVPLTCAQPPRRRHASWGGLCRGSARRSLFSPAPIQQVVDLTVGLGDSLLDGALCIEVAAMEDGGPRVDGAYIDPQMKPSTFDGDEISPIVLLHLPPK
jgi:hypothetical protein